MMKQTKTYLLLLIGVILFLPVRAQVVIQRCDVTTGWKGSWGFSVDYLDKKEGDGALKINAQIVAEQKKGWNDIAKTMQDSIGTAIGNLINMTTTWKSAFQGLLTTMLGAITQYVIAPHLTRFCYNCYVVSSPHHIVIAPHLTRFCYNHPTP